MADDGGKWYCHSEGDGFIEQESGEDMFVHHSAIQGKGVKTLGDEVKVTGGPRATLAASATKQSVGGTLSFKKDAQAHGLTVRHSVRFLLGIFNTGFILPT